MHNDLHNYNDRTVKESMEIFCMNYTIDIQNDRTGENKILTSISHVTNCTNGGNTELSRTFLMTRTVSGGLYHVNL